MHLIDVFKQTSHSNPKRFKKFLLIMIEFFIIFLKIILLYEEYYFFKEPNLLFRFLKLSDINSNAS